MESAGSLAETPARSQRNTSASRPAAQMPDKDPFSTPSASPASTRPKREVATKGKATPDSAAAMAPPPPRKRTKQPTCEASAQPKPMAQVRQVARRQYEAAQATFRAWGPLPRGQSTTALPGYPELPAPGTPAGWTMPQKQVAATGACSTPNPSSSSVAHASPHTGPGETPAAPQQRRSRASFSALQLEERMPGMVEHEGLMQGAAQALEDMERRAIAAEAKFETLTQRVALLERSGRVEAAARIAELELMLQQSEEREAELVAQVSRARERARKVEGQAKLSNARQAKLTTAQEQLRSCKQEADEARADLEEVEEQEDWKAYAQGLQAQLDSGQKWQLTRPKGSGRGAKMYPWQHRVAIWQQLLNGTPPSAIGVNICTVVKLTAPWLQPVEPTAATTRMERFSLGLAEEAMAARRVAEAYAVRQAGFDETSKFQDPSMTTAVVIQPTEGAPMQTVICRAAYAIGGATSEACAEGIEAKCFERLRHHLRGWEATFRRLFPSLEWTGPDAERCGLQRLGGGGAVISDTCTQVRCPPAPCLP